MRFPVVIFMLLTLLSGVLTASQSALMACTDDVEPSRQADGATANDACCNGKGPTAHTGDAEQPEHESKTCSCCHFTAADSVMPEAKISVLGKATQTAAVSGLGLRYISPEKNPAIPPPKA